MKKTLYIFFLLVGLGGIAIQISLIRKKQEIGQTLTTQASNPDGSLPILSKVPGFSLTERTGANFTNQQMKGKVWLVDFVFTKCPDICPLMSSRLSHLQEKAFASGKVGFISFSVDPANDTPAVLREYADHLQAQKDWLFLTGDKNQIQRVAKNGFLLAFHNDGSGVPEEISHSGKIALVDQNGNIRRYYEGSTSDNDHFESESRKMLADIETLLKEGGAN